MNNRVHQRAQETDDLQPKNKTSFIAAPDGKLKKGEESITRSCFSGFFGVYYGEAIRVEFRASVINVPKILTFSVIW